MEKNLKKEMIELTAKVDHKTFVIWATDCAEHVLYYFKEKYPKDNRPRKAIETGRAWVLGTISVGEACSAAVRSTGHAAATVHVVGHTTHAVNYAGTINSYERDWQYQHLLDLVKIQK
jgi:hypothetical protein